LIKIVNILILFIVLATALVDAAPVVLVDSTGALDTSLEYSIFMNRGYALGGEDSERPYALGPRFDIDQLTLVTDIGLFAYHGTLIRGERERAEFSFNVSIYPEDPISGLPCTSCLLGTYALSSMGNESSFAFEQVRPILLLSTGRYFAMFHPTGSDLGSILRGQIRLTVASIGVENVLLEALVPTRIIGETVPEPNTITVVAIASILFGLARMGTRFLWRSRTRDSRLYVSLPHLNDCKEQAAPRCSSIAG
jgi:hypothetical protein